MRYKLLFVFLLFPFLLQAQYKKYGTALIKNYKSEDYKAAPEVFSIIQNHNGLMYFGTFGNILEYDGINWRKIQVKPGRPVLSLAIDSLGTIYCSSGNEFGYIHPDTLGMLKYFSLSKYLDSLDVFGEKNGKVHVNKKGIFFQAKNYIYWYKNLITKNTKLDSLSPQIIQAKNGFEDSYSAGGHIFVLEEKIGLTELKQTQLEPFKYRRFIRRKTVDILPFTNNRVVVCTEKGIYFYKMGHGFLRFDAETDEYLQEISILAAANLPDAFAFATINKGTLVLSKGLVKRKRRIIEQYSKRAGLLTEQISDIYNNPQFDKDLLWLSSIYGISLTRLNSPLRKIYEASAVSDIITDMLWFDDELHVRTLGAVYYMKDTLDRRQFHRVKNINTNSDWIKFTVEEETERSKKRRRWNRRRRPVTRSVDKIIASSRKGLYQIDNRKADRFKFDKVIYKWESRRGGAIYRLRNAPRKYRDYDKINTIYRSKVNPQRIYLGMENGAAVISYQHGEWINESLIRGIEGEVTAINEDQQGNVWFVKKNQGAYKLTLPDTTIEYKRRDPYSRNWRDSITYELFPFFHNVKYYGDSTGLPPMLDNGLYTVGNKLVFSTQMGLYKYNINNDTISSCLTFGEELSKGNAKVMDFAMDKDSNCWMSVRKDYLTTIEYFKRDSSGNYHKLSDAFADFPKMTIKKIFPSKNNLVWISGSEGLFVFNHNAKEDSLIKKNTFIRKIIIGIDSLLFGGASFKSNDNGKFYLSNAFPNDRKVKVHFDYNTIKFVFSAPFYENSESVKFSYLLKNFSKDWSEWNSESEKEFNNLSPGKYVFKVKAKNANKEISRIASFAFEIKPPWYKTWWAYTLYGIIFIALVYLVIKFYTRKLIREKENLERTVDERTSEIRKQKEEIELKNHQITASLNYASRIQEAMLPQEKTIKKYLPESFILFRPRDVVSGDFYWFAVKENKFFYTAVDCTGHGVPGAFMSMIGDSLLNQIVNDKKAREPKRILELLHRGVRVTLKQRETDNRDGMDMVFCMFDPEAKKLYFAGAKNPLLYVQDGKIHKIKGEKVAIGGLQKESHRRFINHEIDASKPTCVYMFSDGFQDQFGGDIGDKFMSGNFKNMLLEIHQKPMNEQKEILQKSLDEWMGNEYNQVDDILVIGFKV